MFREGNISSLVLCALVFFCSCAASTTRTGNTQAIETPEKPEQTPKQGEITDPTCCGSLAPHTEGIDEAWRLFSQGGRYRLALESDLKLPEAAVKELAANRGKSDWEPYNRIFAYSWGHLGYETEHNHLAAIVVDNTRADDAKFSLVIFSKPVGGKYKPYWLYRNSDLSRTIVYQVSGYLGVLNYQTDGKRKGCWVEWNRRQYVCR